MFPQAAMDPVGTKSNREAGTRPVRRPRTDAGRLRVLLSPALAIAYRRAAISVSQWKSPGFD